MKVLDEHTRAMVVSAVSWKLLRRDLGMYAQEVEERYRNSVMTPEEMNVILAFIHAMPDTLLDPIERQAAVIVDTGAASDWQVPT